MREIVKIILERWTQYWGEGAYQWLFLAALGYLLLFKRKKEYVKDILLYVAIVLVLFWFPGTAVIIQKCIGQRVYWRVLWLLLNVPVCALAVTEFLKERHTVGKIIGVCAAVVLISFCGKGLLKSGVYEPAHNNQKIPYEAAMICNLIKEDAKGEQIHLATDDNLASYVRVYDPSITMPYGRGGQGASNRKSKRLYKEICAEEKRYIRIAKYAKAIGCNYIVCNVADEAALLIFEEVGFEVIGTLNQYTIFALRG